MKTAPISKAGVVEWEGVDELEVNDIIPNWKKIPYTRLLLMLGPTQPLTYTANFVALPTRPFPKTQAIIPLQNKWLFFQNQWQWRE